MNIRNRIAALAGFALVAVPFSLAYSATNHPAPTHREPASAAEPSKIERLIDAHGCWTQEGPAGVIPGHVVVSNHDRTWLGGPAVTGQALEQIFDGVDHGLTVHAFCR